MSRLPALFVRGLWGDDQIPRRPKVTGDLRRYRRRKWLVPAPLRIYAFGDENEQLLHAARWGKATVKIHESPVINFTGAAERGTDFHYPWGMSIWRHKLLCLLMGLTDAEQVVWTDWDCRLVRELPDGFWRSMATGAPFQACLSRYTRPRAPWRDRDTTIVPHGSFVYCRERGIIERLLAIMDDNPLWYDEPCYAYLADELLGGWRGPDAYVRAGFHPPDVCVHRPLFPPDHPLFYAPLRYRVGASFPKAE